MQVSQKPAHNNRRVARKPVPLLRSSWPSTIHSPALYGFPRSNSAAHPSNLRPVYTRRPTPPLNAYDDEDESTLLGSVTMCGSLSHRDVVDSEKAVNSGKDIKASHHFNDASHHDDHVTTSTTFTVIKPAIGHCRQKCARRLRAIFLPCLPPLDPDSDSETAPRSPRPVSRLFTSLADFVRHLRHRSRNSHVTPRTVPALTSEVCRPAPLRVWVTQTNEVHIEEPFSTRTSRTRFGDVVDIRAT